MAKIGVLFSNLGTPKSTAPSDVGQYLAEFLMDPFVIQMPAFFRFLLVRGIIVPFRKKKSAANYKKVWSEGGSPLLLETQKAAAALQKELGDEYKVVVGMRYGHPSFAEAAKQLKDCERVIFFPQYPQYAESTVETGLEHFSKYFSAERSVVIPPYFKDPSFIKALAQDFLEKTSGLEFDHLLMSFHGLPESHILKTDPTGEHCLKQKQCCEKAQGDILRNCYRAQCIQSARALAEELKLSEDQYSVSFQSRLGRQKWIEPYTESMYGDLVKKGCGKIAVLCPGFSVDGIETLEEIAMAGREQFMEQGGQDFHFIPCLNDSRYWIEACADMVRQR